MSSSLERGHINVPQLPIALAGTVIHGFGRGSKELGCPTANIPIEQHREILEQIPVGVYAAFASIGSSDVVYKAAMNIGWSPYYKNTEKTIEAHILHEFASDFYGEPLRLLAIAYIRPEANFSSLEGLIEAIMDDIAFTKRLLELPENRSLATHASLKPPCS